MSTKQTIHTIRQTEEGLMWKVCLIVILWLLIPVSTPAQNVGDLSPNPNNNNSIGNPFSPGGSWSVSGQGGSRSPRTAPTSPYTCSNVAPLPELPRSYNQPDPFSFRSPRTPTPIVTESPKGPYGITLPPKPSLGRRWSIMNKTVLIDAKRMISVRSERRYFELIGR